MKITKALKVKNRLVGEMNRLKLILAREHSRKSTDYNTIDVNEVYINLEHTLNDLIKLKASINRATAPIADKLIKMAEYKGMIDFYKNLDTKEGDLDVSRYPATTPMYASYTPFFNQERVDKKLAEIQKEIEFLQDEIDEYNAVTSLDIEF